MTVRYVPMRLRWQPLEPRLARVGDRLAGVLESWEHTPYNTKFADKGVGVYCSAFVSRVLDELYLQPPIELLRIPNDVSFHDRAGANAGLRWFLREYPAATRLQSDFIEPGDVLIVGPTGGGPGHAMIVGPRPNTLWHATGTAGVHYTGLSLADCYEFHAAFRFADREVWA